MMHITHCILQAGSGWQYGEKLLPSQVCFIIISNTYLYSGHQLFIAKFCSRKFCYRADQCFAFVASKPWRSGITKYGKWSGSRKERKARTIGTTKERDGKPENKYSWSPPKCDTFSSSHIVKSYFVTNTKAPTPPAWCNSDILEILFLLRDKNRWPLPLPSRNRKGTERSPISVNLKFCGKITVYWNKQLIF